MHKITYSPGSPAQAPDPRPWHSGALQRDGHPAIWKDGTLHEEACLWLNKEIVPERDSKNTWSAAAQALVTWLDFLEEGGKCWRSATKDDIVAYRTAFQSMISPYTGKELAAGTIRLRMTYIIDFIRFAVVHGWIDSESDLNVGQVFPSLKLQRERDAKEHALANIWTGNPSATKEAVVARLTRLKPKAAQDDKVKVLSRHELASLISWSGPRPSQRHQDNKSGSDRDYILLALGWAVGLRLQGINNLTVYRFLEVTPDPLDTGQFYKVLVTEKGNKTRQVDVPAWLIIDIQAYINGERRRSLRRRGANVRESKLILNSEHSSRSGLAMTASAMQVLMARACVQSGLMVTTERKNLETGEVVIARQSKYSIHCLRHTYAVMTYYNHKKNGYSDLDAWKYIQLQLGHKFPSTTINTYLNHVTAWQNYRNARHLLEML